MIVPPLIRTLTAWLSSVVIAYIVAAVFASQSVANRLAGMGIAMPLPDRVAISLKDLAGMAGSFLPLIAAGFLITFLIAALLGRRLRRWRTPLYVLAGAAAIVAIHIALESAFGIVPVAVARSAPGLASQALAGALGGWVFTRLNGPAAASAAA